MSDTGTPIGAIANTDPVQIDSAVVIANATLGKILQAASGKLEAAIQVSDRYTPGDLILLTTGDQATGNAAQLIAQIVAGIAIVALYRRRPDITMPKLDIVEESKDFLAALAEGVAILPIQEVMDAGILDSQVEQLADVEFRNLPTYIARRLFGRRGKWRDSPES